MKLIPPFLSCLTLESCQPHFFHLSLKRIYNYNSIIKELYPAHDVFPCGIELLEDLIDCLGNELPLNYLNDIPFHHSMGNGYQHRYKSVNLIYSDERLSEYLNKEIIR